MRALILAGLLIAVAGCRRQPPVGRLDANAEVVKVLRAVESSYMIIYSPPVDLAKQPAR